MSQLEPTWANLSQPEPISNWSILFVDASTSDDNGDWELQFLQSLDYGTLSLFAWGRWFCVQFRYVQSLHDKWVSKYKNCFYRVIIKQFLDLAEIFYTLIFHILTFYWICVGIPQFYKLSLRFLALRNNCLKIEETNSDSEELDKEAKVQYTVLCNDDSKPLQSKGHSRTGQSSYMPVIYHYITWNLFLKLFNVSWQFQSR